VCHRLPLASVGAVAVLLATAATAREVPTVSPSEAATPIGPEPRRADSPFGRR
jgi:hypothetical protein